MRVAVAGGFLFVGLLLGYAALHNGGQYALEPWGAMKE